MKTQKKVLVQRKQTVLGVHPHNLKHVQGRNNIHKMGCWKHPSQSLIRLQCFFKNGLSDLYTRGYFLPQIILDLAVSHGDIWSLTVPYNQLQQVWCSPKQRQQEILLGTKRSSSLQAGQLRLGKFKCTALLTLEDEDPASPAGQIGSIERSWIWCCKRNIAGTSIIV